MTPTPPTPGPRATAATDGGHRELVLDGIRGLAILIVLVNHGLIFSGMGRELWFDGLIYQFADSGWFGVDLFFLLSGFLITGILYDAKGSGLHFRSVYGRRILRVFPPLGKALPATKEPPSISPGQVRDSCAAFEGAIRSGCRRTQ